MASLTIRDIPDDLLERMRYSAEQNGRSLDGEAIAAFVQHVGPSPDDPDDVVAMIRAGRDAAANWPPRPGATESLHDGDRA